MAYFSSKHSGLRHSYSGSGWSCQTSVCRGSDDNYSSKVQRTSLAIQDRSNRTRNNAISGFQIQSWNSLNNKQLLALPFDTEPSISSEQSNRLLQREKHSQCVFSPRTSYWIMTARIKSQQHVLQNNRSRRLQPSFWTFPSTHCMRRKLASR